MKSRRLIIYARGAMCAWNHAAGGCVYCGFYRATNGGPRPTRSDFLAQLEAAFQVYQDSGADSVGFYNDGSFLNDAEIDRDTQLQLLTELATWPRLKQITIESRPEYIHADKLASLARTIGSCSLEIATGVDSLDERVLRVATNRGMNPTRTLKTLEDVRRFGFQPTALMVFKLPFMTEQEAVVDARHTICTLLDRGIPVDIEAMTVQAGSVVHLLQSIGYYRTPWLWSIVELLKGLPSLRDVYLSPFRYSVTTDEVPHNCNECTADVARQLVNTVNGSRDKRDLPVPRPCCFCRWKTDFANAETDPLEQRAQRALDTLRRKRTNAVD